MIFGQSVVQNFWITYLLFWAAFLLGIILVRFLPFASKIGERIYNYRVTLLKRWPYTLLQQAIIDHNPVKGAVLIALFLAGRSVFMALLGVVLISPVLLFLGGIFTPCLLTLWRNTRALVWTLAVIAFESAGYALAAGIGVTVGWSWLYQHVPLLDAVSQHAALLLYGFLAVVVLQIVAAVIESTAVIYLRIPGIPLDAIIDEQY
jgi:hypothetical protein